MATANFPAKIRNENDINIKYSSAKICFSRAICELFCGILIVCDMVILPGIIIYVCIILFMFTLTLRAALIKSCFLLFRHSISVWMLSMSLQCVAFVRGKW